MADIFLWDVKRSIGELGHLTFAARAVTHLDGGTARRTLGATRCLNEDTA